MYKSPLADFGEFYDDIIKNENTKDRYFTEDINGIGLDIPRNAVIHDKNKHNLTKEEWQGVLEAIRNGGIKEANLGDKTVMNGTPVKMVVDVNGVEYGVVFEHMKNGRNLVQTAFKLDNKEWIKTRMPGWSPFTHDLTVVSPGHSMSNIIASLDNNVNDTLFQLPAEAYNKQGKADINSKEFKDWYSKVVDENDNTLVVYHSADAGSRNIQSQKLIAFFRKLYIKQSEKKYGIV